MIQQTVRLPLFIFVAALLLSIALLTTTPTVALAMPSNHIAQGILPAPHAQNGTPADENDDDETGQEYIVQPGDSLYKISGQFYNAPADYQRIIDATNAKAAVDPRFTPLTDPRLIQSGQRLWIPNSSALPMIDTTADLADASAAPESTLTTPKARVNFVAPLNGAVVAPTFVVTMTATGLTVEPAGKINPDAGHFHILVDTDFVDAGDVIITDEQHLHFGKGQFTTTLTLEPGEHLLRLQFANGAHLALDGDQYRDTITVTVAPGGATLGSAGPLLEGPGVYFVDPLDGATVPETFTVTMGANELTVEPAGKINPEAGHFHILVDTDFVDPGDVIITDEQHLHFGKGQFTTTLTLQPGEHLLRLQFANGAHLALDGDQYRDTITVTVASAGATLGSAGPMLEGPGVYFVDPLDGATLTETFTVTMGANELTVEPAGKINPEAGHFHILVDTDFVDPGDVIITDEQHLHFGKGQFTTTLTLEPGEHLLRLQFANGAHLALDGDQYRDTITVTVAPAVATPGSAGPPATDAIDVHFVLPKDGATISPHVDVVMAADGLIVEPAGALHANAGHFHILIDTDFVDAGDVIITDDQHLHFGKGQAVTSLDLAPGEHVLRLQFANGAHIALNGDQYQDEIRVMVKE